MRKNHITRDGSQKQAAIFPKNKLLDMEMVVTLPDSRYSEINETKDRDEETVELEDHFADALELAIFTLGLHLSFKEDIVTLKLGAIV